MAPSNGLPVDAEFRGALVELACAILPIGPWVAARPAPWPRAPWRAPGATPLSIRSLHAIDVIDRLIKEEDANLDRRWDKANADPFALVPDPNDARTRWQDAYRAQSFEPKRESGANRPLFRVDAKTWPTVIDIEALAPKDETKPIPDKLPLPATRGAFYEACRTPLLRAVGKQGAVIDWLAFARALLVDDDGVTGWMPAPVRSHRFLRTLARDLLVATLGMKNVDAGDLAFGLLVELREGRRVGNRYSREDVDAAREAFETKLRAKLAP